MKRKQKKQQQQHEEEEEEERGTRPNQDPFQPTRENFFYTLFFIIQFEHLKIVNSSGTGNTNSDPDPMVLV